MRTQYLRLLLCIIAAFSPLLALGQVNSGSDGRDGAFNPTQDTVINMSDHPDGIYQYTTVNIPSGVTVTFAPNANNTPVIWLVQSDFTIAGTVSVKGFKMDGSAGATGAAGGPGGFRGGNGPVSSVDLGQSGYGPGGGIGGRTNEGPAWGGNASFGELGGRYQYSGGSYGQQPAGNTYGNSFILPLIGGSGGGGGSYSSWRNGGGGGGGAILIAASNLIRLDGVISADGGGAIDPGSAYEIAGGGGSGGAIRLIASRLSGGGTLTAAGGRSTAGFDYTYTLAGRGRVRLDILDNNFGGSIDAIWSQGFQPIIIPAPGQGVQVSIGSIGGIAAPPSPGGVLANPDVVIPPQQANPMPVVVNCTNVPLNSQITVTVHPTNGSDVQAVGTNTAGAVSSSTATIPLNVPRGGGIIYATVLTSTGQTSADSRNGSKGSKRSFATTGLAANGEHFAKIETKAFLGGKHETTLITASGKRFVLPH